MKEKKLSAAAEFSKWVKLRNTYAINIYELARSSLNSTPPQNAPYDNVSQGQFTLLMAGLRNLTIRVMQSYQRLKSESDLNNSPRRKARVHNCIGEIATSLDSLSVSPFIDWLGIDLKLNPFVFTHSIDGKDAQLDQIAPELKAAEPEAFLCRQLGSLVFRIYNECVAKVLKLKRFQFNRKLEDASVEFDSELQRACLEVDVVRRRRWFTEMLYASWTERTLREALKARRFIMKRKVFDTFQDSKSQNVKFRHMQLRYQTKISSVVFYAWKRYVIWCWRLHDLIEKVNSRKRREYFFGWKILSKTDFEYRNFKKKRLLSLRRVVFDLLRYHVILNRYHLKQKLKNFHALSFYEEFIRAHCFKRWRVRYVGVTHVDRLEDILQNVRVATLRCGFGRWSENTRPVPPKKHISILSRAASILFQHFPHQEDGNDANDRRRSNASSIFIDKKSVELNDRVPDVNSNKGGTLRDKLMQAIRSSSSVQSIKDFSVVGALTSLASFVGVSTNSAQLMIRGISPSTPRKVNFIAATSSGPGGAPLSAPRLMITKRLKNALKYAQSIGK